MASPGARSPDAPPFGSVTRAPTAAVGDHQHEVEATVRHFQELSAREDARRDAFDREWNANVAAFRHQRDRVEVNMRTRHESQVEDLRKELETALDAPDARPAKWTPQLVDMRRQQKRAVRERKFGEALDLLKSAEEREAEEVEWHRRKMKDDNLAILESLFARQAEERAVFLRECQREEERIEARRAKAARGLTNDRSKAVEDEATRAVDAKRPHFPKPKTQKDKKPLHEPTAEERNKAIGRRVQTKPSLPDAARGAVDRAKGPVLPAYRVKRTGRERYGQRPSENKGYDSWDEDEPGSYQPSSTQRHSDDSYSHGENETRAHSARASLPSTRMTDSPGSVYDIEPQRASPPPTSSMWSRYGGESPAGTPDRDAFYDDNGGVADRLVMRYELDSVRAHEVVLAGLETKYPYAPRSSVPVAMPVAVPAGIQPFPPPSRPSTSLSQPFHQPFHHGVYAFDAQRATHEAWMAQQRAWIAAGVPPPPADFMPFPGTTSLGDPPAISSVDTKDSESSVDTQTPEPEDGLEGVEAKMAADGLMSAALAMAGAGVHKRKSTAAIRKEETRAELETAAAEAGEDLSDDSLDDGMDDLDDVDLVSPGWRRIDRLSSTDHSKNRTKGPGLNLGGVGGYVTGVSSPGPLAAPRRMAGPSQFDGKGAGSDSSVPVSVPEVRAGIHVGNVSKPPPPLEAARGVSNTKHPEGQPDDVRDVPKVARGAAILRRFHGPEDGYRSVRERTGDPGSHGALGRLEDKDLYKREPEPRIPENDFAVEAFRKTHPKSIDVATRTSEMSGMRAAFAHIANARSPLPKKAHANEDPFAPSPPVNRSKGAKDAFQDPFAPSPLSHRREVTVLQTAGLSGAFLDAAKKDAKVNARSHDPFDTNSIDSAQTGGLTANNSAVIKATDEATRIANLDTSFAVTNEGATGAAKARQDAAMAAARSAAFRYGAADRPPPLDSYGQPLAHNNNDASTKLRLNLALLNRPEGEGLDERRLPVPAVGDDVDLVSGLRKEQLDAAARRAMIDQKMMRQRGDAGLAKGEVIAPNPPLRGRRISKRDKTAGETAGPPAGSPGGSSVRSDRSNADLPPATAADIPALFKLFRKGSYEDARGLLKKPGLSVDVRDKFGNTPLIVACQNGHGRLAKMCVRYGADVNAVNHKKNTPLHFTVQYGFNALGDFLVDKGADRDARNDEGKTPYEGL